ncbi:DUF317 domain-containing protein [Kitasatospora purpeofusca]|uniref:DUF317 domain-containing protein n=1 Tax=Kitasatospora purpeofusca TaxID=67352 RepID=UPI0035E08E7D
MNAIPAVSNTLPAALDRASVSAMPQLPPVPARLARTSVEVRPAYLAPATQRSTAQAVRTLRAARWKGTFGAAGAEFRHPSNTTVLVAATGGARTADQLVASGPTWQARFSGRTPDEVLAHAVAALVAHTDHGSDDADIDTALAALAEAGWSGVHRDAGRVHAYAPDAMASLRWGPDEDTGEPGLLVVAGAGGDQWDAELTGADCPPLLVESIMLYLASPVPARRQLGDLHPDLLHDLDVTPENLRVAAAAVRGSQGPSPAASAAPPGASIRTPSAPAGDRPARRAR